jgi:hypothetical protein
MLLDREECAIDMSKEDFKRDLEILMAAQDV